MASTPETMIRTLDVRGEICPYSDDADGHRPEKAPPRGEGVGGGHGPPTVFGDDPDTGRPPGVPDQHRRDGRIGVAPHDHT